LNRRRIVTGLVIAAGVAVLGWTYVQSLVPAIHPDHDHGLENIAGGGALRVEAVEGGKRNLVGRPDRVLILHWFALGTDATTAELPLLIDYARSVESDGGIEVVLVAVKTPRREVLEWARSHGVPTADLYVDPAGKTAQLIGVRRMPETLIYDPEGHLVHQARGPMAWADPELQAGIAQYKEGGGEHQH
jgi:hypothetical protein